MMKPKIAHKYKLWLAGGHTGTQKTCKKHALAGQRPSAYAENVQKVHYDLIYRNYTTIYRNYITSDTLWLAGCKQAWKKYAKQIERTTINNCGWLDPKQHTEACTTAGWILKYTQHVLKIYFG